MGIVILVALGVYLLISLGIVTWAISHARKSGKDVRRWGWSAALVMFLIPCWDWLPTVAVHQFYCAKDSGLWIYKTLDQWSAENPGVLATLVDNKSWPHQRIDGKDVAIINQRIRLTYEDSNELFLHRWPDIRELVDARNNEVLARYVDFSTSQSRGQSGWKFWLQIDSCESGKAGVVEFGNYYLQFKGAGK